MVVKLTPRHRQIARAVGKVEQAVVGVVLLLLARKVAVVNPHVVAVSEGYSIRVGLRYLQISYNDVLPVLDVKSQTVEPCAAASSYDGLVACHRHHVVLLLRVGAVVVKALQVGIQYYYIRFLCPGILLKVGAVSYMHNLSAGPSGGSAQSEVGIVGKAHKPMLCHDACRSARNSK